MASQDWFEKDFYAILGVPKDADAAAIKKTYRKLARKHHPDPNAGDAAAEARFKEIGEAYAVLSDPEQRQQYDAIRAMTPGGARFTAGGPAAAAAASRTSSAGCSAAGGAGAGNVRFSTGGARRPARPRGPARRDVRQGGRCAGGGGFGGFGAPRPAARRRRHGAAPRSASAQAVEGDTVTLRHADGGRASPPGSRPASATGRRSGCAARVARATRARRAGDLVLTVHGRAAPGLRPRRRQPHASTCR